jgi:CubicO group peptidase (beta-lactamase class C family)
MQQLFLFLVTIVVAADPAVAWPKDLQQKLQAVAKMESKKYNCSISIAVRSANDFLAVADGVADFRNTQVQTTVTDKFAWGSCTKMHTAASILNLVSKGAFSLDDTVASLVDDILGKMDRANPGQNFSKVEDLWGKNITSVTVRELLSMKSGVPDFDTATPNPQGANTDPLRAELYKHPQRSDSPTQLMSEPWVASQWVDCKAGSMGPPGVEFCYSSTGFMLLGFILAQHHQVSDWKDFDQSEHLPAYLKEHIVFAMDGTPVSYGSVRGYDRTTYNMPAGTHNDHDNGDVKGVFAGWTASNIVATPSAMANLTWEIYSTNSLAPKALVDEMIPPRPSPLHPFSIYGLGTFNLEMVTGHKDEYGRGYGHFGATYGYQSISGYFPALNITMAIGTNIETDNQVQPTDTFCQAYNAVAEAMLSESITCRFEEHGYFGGVCICSRIPQARLTAIV